jgi:heme-degrading monooxygenase HmoA
VIIRIYRARALEGREAEVANVLRETTPFIGAAQGCFRAETGRRLVERSEEFVVISLWRDMAAIQAFSVASSRGSVDEPFFPDRMIGLISGALIEHYEGIDLR